MQWDTNSTNSYRMGKEGKYDLKLAEPPPAVQPPAEDSDTEDDAGDFTLLPHKVYNHFYNLNLLHILQTIITSVSSFFFQKAS